MPFHKLAFLLITVVAASGVTILVGYELLQSLDLPIFVVRAAFPILVATALIWRILSNRSRSDDPS